MLVKTKAIVISSLKYQEKSLIVKCLTQSDGLKSYFVPNAFSIADAFGLVAGAKMTIGVDTGLTHLSAILGRPTIELYCDSPRWKTEGYWSPNIHNLGDKGQPPSVEEVLSAVAAITDIEATEVA